MTRHAFYLRSLNEIGFINLSSESINYKYFFLFIYYFFSPSFIFQSIYSFYEIQFYIPTQNISKMKPFVRKKTNYYIYVFVYIHTLKDNMIFIT